MKNSQLALEWEIALPAELSLLENKVLVRVAEKKSLYQEYHSLKAEVIRRNIEDILREESRDI